MSTIHYFPFPHEVTGGEPSTTVRKDVKCETCLSLIGPDPEKLDGYHFPATRFANGPHSPHEFIDKAIEEINEVMAEFEGPNDAKAYLMECFDVIQVMESMVRKGCQMTGIRMEDVRQAVYEKNRVRGYYAK